MGARSSLHVGQLKKWRLRASYRPPSGSLLSGVCIVHALDGVVRYTYITYAPVMVADLGKIMPFGLRPDMQGFLIAEEYYDGRWGVFCSYAQKPKVKRLIFETQGRPSWLKWMKEVQDGETQKKNNDSNIRGRSTG